VTEVLASRVSKAESLTINGNVQLLCDATTTSPLILNVSNERDAT